jgi:hypothetical protein
LNEVEHKGWGRAIALSWGNRLGTFWIQLLSHKPVKYGSILGSVIITKMRVLSLFFQGFWPFVFGSFGASETTQISEIEEAKQHLARCLGSEYSVKDQISGN